MSKKNLNNFCFLKVINNFEKRLAADVDKVRKKVRKKFYLKSQHSVSGKTQIFCLFESGFVQCSSNVEQNYVFDNGG